MIIRYIRVYQNGNTVNAGNHWVQVEAYSRWTGENLALGKTVTGDPSNTFATSPSNSEGLQRVTNGNLDTNYYLYSNTNATTYIQIDLGGVTDIEYLKIYNYYGDTRAYNLEIQVAFNTSNWVSVYKSYDPEINETLNSKSFTNVYYETSSGFKIALPDSKPSGLSYNDTAISQKSTVNEYPYYNDSKVDRVYFRGAKVWQKYTPLDFTFNGSVVTKYTGNASSVTIPSSYSIVSDIDGTNIFIAGADYTVNSIGAYAFEGNTSITSVTIPSVITCINRQAFQFCYNLSTVNMSITPARIGYCAFAFTNLSGPSSYMYNCKSLGQGCFAFRKIWCISTSDSTLHTRLRTQAHLGTLSNGGYIGYGITSSFYFYSTCKWTEGSQNSDFTATNITLHAHLLDNNGSSNYDINYNIGNLYQGNERTTGDLYIGTYNTVSVDNPTCGYSCNAHGQTIVRGTWSNYSPSRNSSGRVLIQGHIEIKTDCILQGAKILLANGSYKNIEDLQYTDLLKVWNFELGKYDYQYPLAIIIKGKVQGYRRIHLEDGSHIDITSQHEFFDPVHHTIRVYGSGAIYKINDGDDYYVMKYIDNTTYKSVKIIDIEDMYSEEPIQSYSLVTGGTISYFVDDVLSCMKTIEYVGLTTENKFGKHFAKDKETCYTYDRFEKEIYADSSKYIILGNNLQYVDYYNKDTSGFDGLLTPFKHMLPLPVKNGKIVCTIGFLEDNDLKEEQHVEDELITLPKFKSNKYTKWYVVGEYREYKPGDTITVNFSTLIRAI